MMLAAALVAVTAATAGAQGNGRNTNGVPPGMRPPAGMCRVWIDGVPPGQQPGVTDCVTARAQVRANSRVIFGSGSKASVTRTYNRKRQLADGSWVLDRVTRDANGNIVIVSTKPLVGSGLSKAEGKERKDEWKAEHKGDKKEWKADRKDDKKEWKDEKKEMKGNKGKKDKDENENEDDG
jgi:hypothetical protein